jgi:hypothetical protein
MSLSSHCFFPIKISHNITVDDPRRLENHDVVCSIYLAQAFRRGKDFSVAGTDMSAFEVWDRIGADPTPVIQQLSSEDVQVANRAEWKLIKGGPGVLPQVRKLLSDV